MGIDPRTIRVVKAEAKNAGAPLRLLLRFCSSGDPYSANCDSNQQREPESNVRKYTERDDGDRERQSRCKGSRRPHAREPECKAHLSTYAASPRASGISSDAFCYRGMGNSFCHGVQWDRYRWRLTFVTVARSVRILRRQMTSRRDSKHLRLPCSWYPGVAWNLIWNRITNRAKQDFWSECKSPVIENCAIFRSWSDLRSAT